MEGSFLPLFMGSDGTGPYAVTGPAGAGPLPVQLASAIGGIDVTIINPLPVPVDITTPNPLPVEIAGPNPLPVQIASELGAVPVTLPVTAPTYTVSMYSPLAASGAFLFIQGSPSKKVRIRRIQISGFAASPTAGLVNANITSAIPSGTITAATAYKFDSSAPASTIVAAGYLPGAGALSGSTLMSGRQKIIIVTSATTQAISDYIYTVEPGEQPLTLNNANEVLTLYTALTGPGLVLAASIEWTEE